MLQLLDDLWRRFRNLVGMRLAVILIIVGVAAVAGYQFWGSQQTQQAAYRTEILTRGDIREMVSATGPIDALTTLALNFKTPGRLAELNIRVGDQVTAGQVLARLDTTVLEAQVAAAQADLDQALADYKKLLAGTRVEDRAVAESSVQSAYVTLNTDQSDLKSTQNTSEADLQVAQQEVNNAVVQLDDVQKSLVRTRDTNAADLTATQQEVDNAAIQLTDAQQNLTRVKGVNAADIAAVQQEIENAVTQVHDVQAGLELVQASNAADIEVAQHSVGLANTELQNAQVNLEQVVLPQNEKDIAVAQAGVQSAAVDLTNAQRDLEAVETGPEAVAVRNAQTSVADAEANLAAVQQVADANRRAAETSLANAQAELQSTKLYKSRVASDSDATMTQKADADTRVVQAQSSVNNAEINLEQVRAENAQQITSAQTQLNDARASLATAQANLDQARRNAQSQVDSAKAELDRQQADLARAQTQAAGNAQTAQNDITHATVRLPQAQAELKRAQAQAASSLQGAQQDVHQTNATLANAQAKLNQTQAQTDSALQSAQENINQANASLRSAEVSLRQIEAQAASALHNAEQQVHDVNNSLLMAQARLIQTQAQTSSSLQSAQAQIAQAESSLQSAVADYNKTVAPAHEQDLEAARARIENATARLWEAQENLDNAILRAPVAGTVAQVNGEVGEYIGSSATLSSSLSKPGDVRSGFILLTNLSGFKVIAEVNEVDIGRVAPGQRVEFTVDAYPERTFTGTVATITPVGTSTQDVINYNVEIVADPADVTLLPNMTANVNIVATERQDVVLVPKRAVDTRGGRKWVEVIRDGKPVEVAISAGLSDGIYSEVLEGLSEGDEVIVERIAAEALSSLEEMEEQRDKFLRLREIGGR